MTKEDTHYLVLSVKDLKALLSMARKGASLAKRKSNGWTPDMHTVVMRFNENSEYEGQLNITNVLGSRMGMKTMNEIRRGDF